MLRRVVALSCFAVLGISQEPPVVTEEARVFIEERFLAAKQAESAGNLGRAAEEYQAIVSKYPDALPEVYQNLGLVHYLQRNYEEAARVFGAGLERKPEMLGSHLFLGSSLLFLERPAEAIPHLEYAHERQPTVESARYLGLAYTATDRIESALPFFKMALESASEADKPNYLYLIGDSYLKISERIANSPYTQKPESAHDHLFTARVLDSQGWAKLAARQYLEAAKKDPGHAGIFCHFARTLGCLGLKTASKLALARYRALAGVASGDETGCEPDACPPARAMAALPVDFDAELRTLPAITEQSRPLVPLAGREVNDEIRSRVAQDRIGNWKLAVEHLGQRRFAAAADALRSLPSLDGWLRDYLLASALVWNRDFDAAGQILGQPQLASVRTAPVEALRWEVNQQLSVAYFNALLEEYPNSARAHFLKARTLNALGDPDAGKEYKAAIEAGPDQLEFHLGLADFYAANSQFTEAIEESRKELALNPNSRAAMMRIGRIHVLLREAAKAMPYLEKSVEAYPQAAELRADMGRALELLGQKQRAAAEYRAALELDPSMNRVRFLLAQLYTAIGEKELAQREFDLYRKQLARERIGSKRGGQ